VGNKFAVAEKHCESEWEKFWHDVIDVVEVIVDIAKYICKYSEAIMEGTAEVGLEEAVPIEAAFVGAVCSSVYLEAAIDTIKTYDDGKDCVELGYAVKQYTTYSEQVGSVFNYDIGKFAGEVYKNGKNCVKFPEDVAKDAKLAASLIPDESVRMPGMKEVNLMPRRRLTTVEPSLISTAPITKKSTLIKSSQCQYCLSEHEFFSFLQGVYDGQAYFDKSLPAINVEDCISKTDSLINLFTGQL
jgi:hypothetical protein